MPKQTWKTLAPQLRLVWQLSLPAILTQITTIAMQYIDSAMVGALGADASAAIGLVASSTWLFGGVTTAVSAGFSVQVAHRIGAGEDTEARTIVRHGLAAALTLAALLALLGLGICRQLPCWLGGGAEICADASAYFLTFSLMLPFSQLNSLTAGFLQCAGDMVTPSVLNAVMCGLDVVCNALLIPHFGVLGAGMGTALACALVSLAMAWCCCVRNAQLRLRRGEAHAFRPEILKKAFRIGAAGGGAGDRHERGDGRLDHDPGAAGRGGHRGQLLRGDGGEPVLHAGLRRRLSRDHACRPQRRRW